MHTTFCYKFWISSAHHLQFWEPTTSALAQCTKKITKSCYSFYAVVFSFNIVSPNCLPYNPSHTNNKNGLYFTCHMCSPTYFRLLSSKPRLEFSVIVYSSAIHSRNLRIISIVVQFMSKKFHLKFSARH